MPRRKKARDPFEVELTEAEQTALVTRLAYEIDEAIMARESIVGSDGLIDQWHHTYEGGDKNISKTTPWPGAANLTSWIGTEKVDAFRSRVVKTIFAEPIWIVSAWGKSASDIQVVEKFHQWKAEEERLQGYLSRVVHLGLIEGTGVLEVSERPVLRKQRQRLRAMAEVNDAGIPVGDEEGEKVPMLNEQGSPVEAPEGTEESLTTLVILDRMLKTRGGPQYRVLNLRDFFIMPGHAKDRKDVWGYAKRVWKKLPDLHGLALLGVYSNVDALGEEDEREQSPEMLKEGQGLAAQSGPTAEKEIWELTFLDDLDHDGIQEWYVATFHKDKRVLLRLQRDDLGQARYLFFIPFPRPQFLYGYSLIGHKLDTVIDEHTAWRNMIADRVNMVINAPMKRLVGSLWNPQAVPWSPRAVIPVRDMNEVQAMQIPDLPSSVVHREQSILAASERVAGMVDTAAGSHPSENRTLGEVKTVMGESLIRIDEVVHHLQESMEDLFQIRHEIWKRTLRERQEPLPLDLMASLESKGLEVPEFVTAEMMEGAFRGKPRGSVETADMGVMRNDFVAFLTAMTQFSQAVPTFGMMFQDPELGKEILFQAVRVFRWENREAIEQAIERATQKAQQTMAMQGGMGGPGGPPQGQAGPNGLTAKMGVTGAKKPAGKPAKPLLPPGQKGMMGGNE
jgi:hypothetical protein